MTKFRKLKVDFFYTKENFDKIKAGYIAESMDDKWDIVYEDDWLHFYRSWTGIEIYRAKFTPLSDGNYKLQEILVNNDENQADEVVNDNYDRFMVEHLIQDWLLKQFKNMTGGAFTFHWTGVLLERKF